MKMKMMMIMIMIDEFTNILCYQGTGTAGYSCLPGMLGTRKIIQKKGRKHHAQ